VQTLRYSTRPSIGTRYFNGSRKIAGVVMDASSPGEPLVRRMRLFTDTGLLVSETYSAEDGSYVFPNLRDDADDLVPGGFVVTKQRDGFDGFAQMRDRIQTVPE
jgi:hypothetical protein